MINSIGQFGFISLRGSLDVPTEQIDRETIRRGVHGIGLWKTGRRARRSRVRTAVDAQSLSEARTYLAMYRLLIGEDPAIVIQNDHHFDAANQCRFAVLVVRETQMQWVGAACGGLNPPSLAYLVCEWELIGIENVQA